MDHPGKGTNAAMTRLPLAARLGVATLAAVASLAIAYLFLGGRDEATTGVRRASGDLLAAVQRLVDEMPRPESQAYDVPTSHETAALASAFGDIEAGHLDDAARLAAPLHYEVVSYSDTATGRKLVLLQELQNADGSWPHGWGLYVFDPASTSHLIVEVAHPLDDINTAIVGVEIFRVGSARALLIAGASRFADPEGVADVAHNDYSVFESIHEAALRPGLTVVEPHGFETDNQPSYGDIVVSTGASPPDRQVTLLAAQLRKEGFDVCLYDGVNCTALGGTTNVQGISTRAAGDAFLHVEMSLAVRNDPTLRVTVARVIARTVGDPSNSL